MKEAITLMINFLEFIKELRIEYDDFGNVWIDTRESPCCIEEWFCLYDKLDLIESGYYFLSKENYEKISQIKIQIDVDIEEIDRYMSRRPYFRMRGEPVSREQAYDIIRRTLGELQLDTWPRNKPKYPDYISLYHFSVSQGRTWITSEGAVGGNLITGRLPKFRELLDEIMNIVIEFPYLKFAIAMTNLDDYAWEIEGKEYEEKDGIFYYKEQPDRPSVEFYPMISYGFIYANGVLKIKGKKEATKMYQHYESVCGFPESYYDSDVAKQRVLKKNDIEKIIESYHLPEDKRKEIRKRVGLDLSVNPI